MVVDNSDFSPNRLTVSLDSSYPSLLVRKLPIPPISSSEDRYGISGILVPTRVLPPTHPGMPRAPLFAPSEAFHSKAGIIHAAVQRLLKPRTPLDCPACRLSYTPSSSMRSVPDPVRPWSEVKSS
jgi:hypothetical protein